MKQTLIKTRRVVVTFFFLSFLNNPYRSYRGLIGVLCEVGEGEQGGEYSSKACKCASQHSCHLQGGEDAPPESASIPATIWTTINKNFDKKLKILKKMKNFEKNVKF